MNLRIRLILLAVIIGFLVVIGTSVRRRSMQARYLVLWTTLCVAVTPLVMIPGAIDQVGSAVGVYYPPTVLLAGAILVLFGVDIHFSREISRLEEKTRILAEELALDRLDHGVVASAGAQDRAAAAVPSRELPVGQRPEGDAPGV